MAGDTVEIAPGTYYDCAVWNQPRLRLRATGPGVLLTDSTCQEKAIWIIAGDDATVEGIAFARARVPDGNGAGIRLEGSGLTLDGCIFDNDETGLLASGTGGAIVVKRSRFERNKRALLIGPADELALSETRIEGTRGSDAVTSSAKRTTVHKGTIGDDANGAASCLLVAYGDLFIQNSDLRKSSASGRPDCVVLAGPESGHVVVWDSKLVSDTATTFVRMSSSSTNVDMGGITAEGDITMLRGESARMMAGRLRRAIGTAAGFLRHAIHAALEGGRPLR